MKIVEASGDGPIVFLLHGFPSTSGLWFRQVESLAEAAHVVLVDVEGADRLADLIAMSTEFLAAIKRRFPDRKVLVVAHDIGCFIANEIALARADLIDGQILINGAGIAQFVSRSWPQWRRSLYVVLLEIPCVPFLVKFLRNWSQRAIYAAANVPRNSCLRLPSMTNLEPIGLYRELVRRGLVARASISAAPRCVVPTLHVASDADPFLVVPTLPELSRFFVTPALACIRGGHFSPVTEPETINHLIHQELAALEIMEDAQ